MKPPTRLGPPSGGKRHALLLAALAACSAGARNDPAAGGSTVVIAPPPALGSAPAPEAQPPAPQPAAGDAAREAAMLDRCSRLAPPGAGCPGFESSQSGCAAFARFMRPASAEAATECMVARSGTADLCLDGHCAPGDPMCSDISPNDLVNRCLQQGIREAVPDPAHADTCQDVARACGNKGMGTPGLEASCQKALSAMKPEHTRLALACVKIGCNLDYCGFELSLQNSPG